MSYVRGINIRSAINPLRLPCIIAPAGRNCSILQISSSRSFSMPKIFSSVIRVGKHKLPKLSSGLIVTQDPVLQSVDAISTFVVGRQIRRACRVVGRIIDRRCVWSKVSYTNNTPRYSVSCRPAYFMLPSFEVGWPATLSHWSTANRSGHLSGILNGHL